MNTPSFSPEVAPEVAYVGHDQLQAMQSAVRYNASLAARAHAALCTCPRVADFGAGLGDMAAAMQHAGHAVVAVEPDAGQCAALRARGLNATDHPQGIAPGSLDGAYSANVLEHIEDDVQALTEWGYAIKPGGLIWLYVPAFPVLYSAMDRAVGHYRRYTRKSLESCVRAAGLEVVRSGYADSLGFFAALALRWRAGDGQISPQMVALYDRWVFPLSQQLDRWVGPWFGKNVWVIARKPGGAGPRAAQ